ncbi:Mannan endo-1-6-alpha-mannosidase [Apiospora phragmitis]|uniref:Mannan endo-1,6-alpha-mannosidase n=1 Tax=Apiospora phragmitis TaxID=2905665 RepID=A0ABR1VFP1_9PEZI
MHFAASTLACLSLLVGGSNGALDVDFGSKDSIKQAAKLVATDLMSFYKGDQPGMLPGMLPGPASTTGQRDLYFWWQSGAMWGTMIDYWHYTGDETWNDKVIFGLLGQAGENHDFNPSNWSLQMGNDDQAFWGMASLGAAETKFKDPPPSEPQWLALTQAVWNEQQKRLTTGFDKDCNGGLHWQVFSGNQGYDYKNTISNGAFFNMGARLALYSDNKTYAEIAEQTWDWISGVGLIDKDWNVYDGTNTGPDKDHPGKELNCTNINKLQYSYNAAIMIQGASVMYKYTKDDKWASRVESLTKRTLEFFFPNGTAYEPTCEQALCTMDATSFKGYLHRWLGYAVQMVPAIRDTVMPVLESSARAAVKTCTGGDNGRMCGFRWSTGAFDNEVGAGQQMNVLGALSILLLDDAPPLVTSASGGTSQGNPNAGAKDRNPAELRDITHGDRVGAGFVTLFLLLAGVGTYLWMDF